MSDQKADAVREAVERARENIVAAIERQHALIRQSALRQRQLTERIAAVVARRRG